MKLARWILGVFACISISVFANEQQETVEQALCKYVKQDSERQFFSTVIANDIRLFSNYRSIHCKAELGFEGGSLLKTADHFGSKRLFNRLLQTIEVDDIFWEQPVSQASRERALASRN